MGLQQGTMRSAPGRPCTALLGAITPTNHLVADEFAPEVIARRMSQGEPTCSLVIMKLRGRGRVRLYPPAISVSVYWHDEAQPSTTASTPSFAGITASNRGGAMARTVAVAAARFALGASIYRRSPAPVFYIWNKYHPARYGLVRLNTCGPWSSPIVQLLSIVFVAALFEVEVSRPSIAGADMSRAAGTRVDELASRADVDGVDRWPGGGRNSWGVYVMFLQQFHWAVSTMFI